MRYFQLINTTGNYPLVGVKQIWKEQNDVQTLISKKDIIANFPGETLPIARDLSKEEYLFLLK